MSIYQKLVAAQVPVDNHESDLYALVTPRSHSILEEYRFRESCSIFRSEIDWQLWYEIPFAYDPFWQARSAR